MMTKHTPGPWWADTGCRCENITIYGTETGDAVDVCDVVYRGDEIQIEANARLIAAAPDLLAALELILTAEERGFGADYIKGCARAAIAKAKGKTK